MNEEKKTETDQPATNLLVFMYHWRKHLFVISIVAAFFSGLISFLIAPQYKAVAGVFAMRSFTASKYLTEEDKGNKEDFLDIGDEDDIEKLMQILNSTELQELVVKKYNLFNHWKISTDDPNKNTWMSLKFAEMISYKRTDMLSVKIEVFDYSPDTAALIANSITELADTVKKHFAKRIAVDALNIIKEEYSKNLTFMQLLEDSMQRLRSKGILDYNLQVEAFSKSLGKALAGGNGAGAQKIEDKLKNLELYGGPYLSLTNEFILQKERQVFLKNRLDDAYLNSTRIMPSNVVVQKAIKPDRKAKPIRWLIVFVSTISALLVAIMALVSVDRYKQFKKKMLAGC